MREKLSNKIIHSLNIEGYYRGELESFKREGKNQAKFLCPFHDDTKPSLSVNLKTGNFYCFGCKRKGSIFDFYMMKRGVDFKRALKDLAEKAGIKSRQKRRIVKTYNYKDDKGKLLYQSVRYEPKDFSQRRPDGKGDWIYNLEGIDKVPYNLPKILKYKFIKKPLKKPFGNKKYFRIPRIVFIVEGERDADALTGIGFLATCNPMGAGKWREEYNQHFKGVDVAIVPDNDEPGRKHAEEVAQNLKGVAQSVRVIHLPELPEKGDVSDWLNKGGTKKELLALVESTPVWEEPDPLSFLVKGYDLMKSDIKVEWMIDKLVPEKSITLLHGRGGIGKTWLSLQLANNVSKGNPFMGLVTKKLPVVYIDFENSLPVLIERVKAIKASKVLFWHLSNTKRRPPRLDKNEWIEYKNLYENSLLIFDTLRAAQSLDENSSRDMSIVLNQLKELREMGFTIILLHHTPKARETIYKGSTAILDLADHVLSLHRVKKGKPDEEADEDDTDFYYWFGTTHKTRYTPFNIFLEFIPDTGFVLAPDPDDKNMKKMHSLMKRYKKTHGKFPNQSDLCKKCKKEFGLAQWETRRLLKKGIGTYWSVKKGLRNATLYDPLVFQFFKDIYMKKTEKLTGVTKGHADEHVNPYCVKLRRPMKVGLHGLLKTT